MQFELPNLYEEGLSHNYVCIGIHNDRAYLLSSSQKSLCRFTLSSGSFGEVSILPAPFYGNGDDAVLDTGSGNHIVAGYITQSGYIILVGIDLSAYTIDIYRLNKDNAWVKTYSTPIPVTRYSTNRYSVKIIQPHYVSSDEVFVAVAINDADYTNRNHHVACYIFSLSERDIIRKYSDLISFDFGPYIATRLSAVLCLPSYVSVSYFPTMHFYFNSSDRQGGIHAYRLVKDKLEKPNASDVLNWPHGLISSNGTVVRIVDVDQTSKKLCFTVSSSSFNGDTSIRTRVLMDTTSKTYKELTPIGKFSFDRTNSACYCMVITAMDSNVQGSTRTRFWKLNI
ncbi:hypothetical protein [Gottschalkia purinilytica]|uniref:hypothetical protein n=1 Tax=Gottschalkia purinilytica TaxID=1503 RepID=UPI0012FF27D7|nr:hypothetical protein [Gottschalkia purinilytica]